MIAKAFALAQRYHQAGAFAQAAAVYRQILQADPANAPVLFHLGAACEALRDLPEAVACYRRVAQLVPDRAEVYNQLGMTLYKQGNLKEAAAAHRQALQLRPDLAEAHANLGLTFQSQGQWSQAMACYQQALSLRPDLAEVHYNLGMVYVQHGALQEATASYERALQLKPGLLPAYTGLGNALRVQGRPHEAAACYRQALRLAPDFADALYNLGATLRELGREEEADDTFREVLRLHPALPEAHNSVGSALRDEGDVEGAVGAYREALRLRPDYAEAHLNLAHALEEQGGPAEAVQHALEAVRVRPNWAPPRFILAELAVHGHYQFPEAEIRRVAALAQGPDTSPGDASLLHFALALLDEKRGAYDDAFASYRQGNVLMHRLLHKAGRAYKPEEHKRAVDRLIETFSPALFQRVQGYGLDTELPVFIVGMPRSGTTLVEQILSRHPLVFGAGELQHVTRLVAELAARLGVRENYPGCMDCLNLPAARAMARDYLARLSRRGGRAVRVIDKQGQNYLHLGLLAVLFPRARVIHCRRDPRDVCVSCYCQYFREVNFAWDLGELGRYYRQYERLMDHWRAVLPAGPLEVVYEELVAHPEAVSRQLVAFCGLDWDDRCLAFHESPRAVQTMSKLQVRQPIFTTSVGRWRRYEAHLGPLLEALGQG
jgi:tetratricopeptide (TPR) repeat protein